MPSTANMDTVGITSSRVSLSEDLKNKSEVTYDEKACDGIVELEGRQPRPHFKGFRIVQDIFNKWTFTSLGAVLWKFGRFMGPGTIISVAYIDPDNFQTAVSSGAQFKYKLLFMVLLSNVIAIFLQVCLATPNSGHMLSLQVSCHQVGDCHWDGLGTDESSEPSKMAQLLIMVYG
jgi:hypothetical protein